MYSNNYKTLYHATSSQAWKSIKHQGLKPGSDGMLGAGIYFAETPESAKFKARFKEVVLKATVNVGNFLKVTNKNFKYTKEEINDLGYDSIYCHVPGKEPEWLVFDSSQVTNITLHTEEKGDDIFSLFQVTRGLPTSFVSFQSIKTVYTPRSGSSGNMSFTQSTKIVVFKGFGFNL